MLDVAPWWRTQASIVIEFRSAKIIFCCPSKAVGPLQIRFFCSTVRSCWLLSSDGLCSKVCVMQCNMPSLNFGHTMALTNFIIFGECSKGSFWWLVKVINGSWVKIINWKWMSCKQMKENNRTVLQVTCIRTHKNRDLSLSHCHLALGNKAFWFWEHEKQETLNFNALSRH